MIRRLTLLSLVLALLLVILGCTPPPMTETSDGVNFFYERTSYLYGEKTAVIGMEHRDVHNRDPGYLLALYLEGPLDENLRVSFPDTTELLSLRQEDQIIYIELSDLKDDLDDASFSLACGCLTMTCLNLTDAEVVYITSADRFVRMSRNNLNFYDNSSAITEPEESK